MELVIACSNHASHPYIKEINMELLRAKGTEDYEPERKILRETIISSLKKVFERYGFNTLETPILELYSTLSAKYAGGAEILKETFRLKDQGDRDLGLRYDLTVPLARFIAMNPQIGFPFKRYQIEKVFRDGPVTKARIREFWQCDVDTVGVKNLRADVEIIKLALDVMKELKLKCKIKVNNRKLLNEMCAYANIQENKESVILSIDKMYKIGKEGVMKELREKKIPEGSIKKIFTLISGSGTNLQKLERIEKKMKGQGVQELKEAFRYFGKEVEFDPCLARGLSYYTGTIFEIVLKDENLGCSVGGGGRYDNMIGGFSGNREIPAVGISFGLEPLTWAVSQKKTMVKSVTQLYVIPINTFSKSLKIVEKLRASGLNVDIDLNNRNISKNLNYANALGIPYVLFIGEDELKKKKVKLRDMKTGKEQFLSVEKVVSFLKKEFSS